MEIQLNNVGKKFNKEWIFKGVNYNLAQNTPTAIVGPNGSGKSTLLQIIAGCLLLTEGEVRYIEDSMKVQSEDIYKKLSLVAPSLSLPDDFTLEEFIGFHFKFKQLKSGYKKEDLPAIFKLEKAKDKFIKNFSTGMKQRLKLGISFYSNTPMLLLDEPATNLDRSGVEWYMEEIEKVIDEKMIIVCSNRKDEYEFCNNFIDILEFKK